MFEKGHVFHATSTSISLDDGVRDSDSDIIYKRIIHLPTTVGRALHNKFVYTK